MCKPNPLFAQILSCPTVIPKLLPKLRNAASHRPRDRDRNTEPGRAQARAGFPQGGKGQRSKGHLKQSLRGSTCKDPRPGWLWLRGGSSVKQGWTRAQASVDKLSGSSPLRAGEGRTSPRSPPSSSHPRIIQGSLFPEAIYFQR